MVTQELFVTSIQGYSFFRCLCVGISAEQLLGYRATKKRRFFLLLVLFGGEGLMLYVR